jgi:hypothetical protein
MRAPEEEANPNFPMTLDLRRPAKWVANTPIKQTEKSRVASTSGGASKSDE